MVIYACNLEYILGGGDPYPLIILQYFLLWVREVHMGVREVHMGVREVHMGVREVHMGVREVRTAVHIFGGYWAY